MTQAKRFLAILLLLAGSAAAQQGGPDQPPPQGKATPGASEAPAEKAKPARQPGALMAEKYSEDVATALLSRVADGFTRRNARLLLSAFDAQRVSEYARFAERVRARLAEHDSFRAYYRIVSTAGEESGGAATVELQIEESFAGNTVPPARTMGQARFTFRRGANGWRIVAVAPPELITGARGARQSSR